MPSKDNNNVIIAGPFTDNHNQLSNSSNTSDVLSLSHIRLPTITPRSNSSKRQQSGRVDTASVDAITASTQQTISTSYQREIHHFERPWCSMNPINHDFNLDSGCTHHMVWNPYLFTKFVGNGDGDPLNLGSVIVGHGLPLPIRGYGNIWPFGCVF